MSNVRIDYEGIVNGISAQFSTLISEISSSQEAAMQELWNTIKAIAGAGIIVEDEQMYIKHKDINANSIYIVVKFGSASTNFGASVCNINLLVFGQENKIKPTQALLGAFVSRWSTHNLNNNSLIQQIWVSPSVVSNFNTTGNAFRSLFSVNGTLVIGSETIVLGSMTYIYGSGGNDYEEIPFLAYQDNFSNKLSPQPFGNTYGFTKSESDFATFSFSISTYLLNNHFCRDCLALRGFRYHGSTAALGSTKGQNDPFKIVLHFNLGNTSEYYFNGTDAVDTDYNNFMQNFKCVSITIGQKIGDFPTINVSFSH